MSTDIRVEASSTTTTTVASTQHCVVLSPAGSSLIMSECLNKQREHCTRQASQVHKAVSIQLHNIVQQQCTDDHGLVVDGQACV